MDTKIELKGLRVPVKEEVHGEMTGQDIADTSDAMYRCKCKMNDIMADMTLNEVEMLVKMAADYKQKMRGQPASMTDQPGYRKW